MVYTPDLEEHLRLRQMLHDSREQPKYYPGNFAMQPPAFAVGHPPGLSTDCPLYGLSMSNAAASIEPRDWPLRGSSVNHAAASNGPKDWPVYNPSMIHASASIGPKDELLYGPSMNHATASLDPNWTMHTTTGNPVVDNSYQSSMRSSSTMRHRATKDYLSPGRTSSYTQSSAPSPSTPETTARPNENNFEVVDVEAISAHGDLHQQE